MKTALISGSSRGIGAATAEKLARAGYAVCINCVEREDKAAQLVERLRAEGCVAMAYTADVSDSAAVDAMVKTVEDQLGHINLLVNNAGISERHQFQDISPEWWKRIFDVNLGGCFNCTRAVLPPMLRLHEGCIINISSIWGHHGASCEVAYSSTKHAIIGFTRSLAMELSPTGIRVNCIAPGVIDTDMVQVLGEETLSSLARDVIPMGRLGKPEEIAEAVLFLAEKATYTTGHVFTADGGFII